MPATRIASDDFEGDIDLDSLGIGGARQGAAVHRGAFWARPIFVKLLHGLRWKDQKYCNVWRFEKVVFGGGGREYYLIE